MAKQVIRAMPDWRKRWKAIAIMLFLFSGGMFFFAGGAFNAKLQELLENTFGDGYLAIGVMLLLASFISTLGYIIWEKKK